MQTQSDQGAIEMEFLRLQPGDIILQVTNYGISHSIIWVSDAEYCIAESSAGDLMKGVRLATRKEFIRGDDVGTITSSRVYRFDKDKDIAKEAARYATVWARKSTDESHMHPGTTYRDRIAKGIKNAMPTPWQSREKPNSKWTPPDGLFQMARAFVREQQGKPLSANKGLGCAAFVTYCYQVASLKVKFGNNLPSAQMGLMADFVELKNNANVAWIAKRSEKEFEALSDAEFMAAEGRKTVPQYATASAARVKAKASFANIDKAQSERLIAAVPPELMRDAATASTKGLQDAFDEGTDFKLLGYLIGNHPGLKSSTKVGLVPFGAAPKNKTDVKKFLEDVEAATGWT